MEFIETKIVEFTGDVVGYIKFDLFSEAIIVREHSLESVKLFDTNSAIVKFFKEEYPSKKVTILKDSDIWE